MTSTQSSAYIEFIARIRLARRSSHISQKELASRLGKGQSFVAKVETCERRLDVIEATQWCAALNIHLMDVIPTHLLGIAAHIQHHQEDDQ